MYKDHKKSLFSMQWEILHSHSDSKVPRKTAKLNTKLYENREVSQTLKKNLDYILNLRSKSFVSKTTDIVVLHVSVRN